MRGKVGLGTHAFFQWICSWGKHQYKNRLFLGPQYLGSVNAWVIFYEDDTLGYCWDAAPIQLGGAGGGGGGRGLNGIPSWAFPGNIASAILIAKSSLKYQEEHDLIFQIASSASRYTTALDPSFSLKSLREAVNLLRSDFSFLVHLKFLG